MHLSDLYEQQHTTGQAYQVPMHIRTHLLYSHSLAELVFPYAQIINYRYTLYLCVFTHKCIILPSVWKQIFMNCF